jgi:hypothetical protein
MRTWAALAVCVAASLGAEAATFVRLQSQPGDPTLGGAQQVEYDAPGTGFYSFSVIPNTAGGVDFIRQPNCSQNCTSTSDVTAVQFAPAAGNVFAPGTYASAQRYSRNGTSSPGLFADTMARNVERCSSITGSFVVREIARAPDGTVQRFAADFEQHCNGEAPALYGGVRFNSDVPYTQPVPYAPAAMRFFSEPGDPIGGGNTGAFVVLDGQTFAAPQVQGVVSLSLNAPDGSAVWSAAFNPGSSESLQPQTSYNAVAPGGPSTVPSVYVANMGTTCPSASYSSAHFFVHEIEWSPQNYLVRFAADVTIQCTGATGAFHGGVRYNSRVPYVSPPNGPSATANLANGSTISVSLRTSDPACGFSEVSLPDLAATSPPTPEPRFVAFPYPPIEFRTANCGTGTSIPVDVDLPDILPPTAQWWSFGPTFDNATPHWYPIPSAVSGNRISFTVTDGKGGDVELVADGSVKSFGMVVIPGGPYQDLWWSGIQENGWGFSIVQHRDILFGNLFVYDANGAPTWYVMPSGSWDAAHVVYNGALYLPKGSPYFAYDVRSFDIGAAVGNARLSIVDVNHISFDYVINGVTGHKDLTRIPFGPQDAPTDVPLGDLWWAGIGQNGWGIALQQQFSSLFGVWFTYDAAGKATWFVMPSGAWLQKNDYRGKIYRVVGSPWVGATYDASRHQTIEAGTFRYFFSGDGASFEYTLDGHSGTIPLSRIPF